MCSDCWDIVKQVAWIVKPGCSSSRFLFSFSNRSASSELTGLPSSSRGIMRPWNGHWNYIPFNFSSLVLLISIYSHHEVRISFYHSTKQNSQCFFNRTALLLLFWPLLYLDVHTKIHLALVLCTCAPQVWISQRMWYISTSSLQTAPCFQLPPPPREAPRTGAVMCA